MILKMIWNSNWWQFREFKDFELNNIGVGTSSSTNVHNISVDTSSDTNNPLDDIDIDECLRNNEQDEDNKASFSLHDILANCLLMKNYLNYVWIFIWSMYFKVLELYMKKKFLTILWFYYPSLFCIFRDVLKIRFWQSWIKLLLSIG